MTKNKKKIINDPVYGFINIPANIIYDVISHPYFQRLRRIKQLGLSDYVYPGATHTRFEHVVGATHLMHSALDVLKFKKIKLSKDERTGAMLAILMHDLGHGPYSHTLEGFFAQGISHEDISLLFMEKINADLDGRISTGIEIFKNKYERHFLHNLVSGQLDMDRLDYLRRDSFFTGVSEGVIGSDRIIKMLNVKDNELVVEEKGIYSVEKFLIARRIMYWQVYLHKTVVAAELMLLKILQRAREIIQTREIFTTPALYYFLKNKITRTDFTENDIALKQFSNLDDSDILASIKQWTSDSDKVLSQLCKRLLSRDLFHLEIQIQPFDDALVADITQKTAHHFHLDQNEVKYFVFSDKLSNKAYTTDRASGINILLKNGEIRDIAQASDISNISTLSETVKKFVLIYPKEIHG